MFVIPPIATIGIFVNFFALFKVFIFDLNLVFLFLLEKSSKCNVVTLFLIAFFASLIEL